MVSRMLVIVSVIVLVFSGCTGGVPGSELLERSPPDERTYEYQGLSNQSQQAFLRLKSEESVLSADRLFVPETDAHSNSSFFVHYQGTYYEIDHQVRMEAEVVCLKGLQPDTPGEDDAVGEYTDLGPEEASLVDEVVSGAADSRCFEPDSYPLAEYSHIRINDTTYRLVELHGSNWVYWYSLSKYQPK